MSALQDLPELTWADRIDTDGRVVESYYRIGLGWWEFTLPGRLAARFVARLVDRPGTTLRPRAA